MKVTGPPKEASDDSEIQDGARLGLRRERNRGGLLLEPAVLEDLLAAGPAKRAVLHDRGDQ